MILLVGAGPMAFAYAEVLGAMDKKYLVVGRGAASAAEFSKRFDVPVLTGGVESNSSQITGLKTAIVSVNVEYLYQCCSQLLDLGCENILIEKPGALSYRDVVELRKKADLNSAKVYIAYNRRFFASTLAAEKFIFEEGGVSSFNFELTEWGHVIAKLDKSKLALETWFLGNSTHVADLAFFLGGVPSKISTYTAGSLDWHSSAAVFAGSGITRNDAVFNYGADWQSAGRWSVEVLTKENKYILCPMEKLHRQKRGTVHIEELEIDDSLDIQFKPGLFLQVEAFLAGNAKNLCHLNDHLLLYKIYERMAGYVEG